MSKIYEKAAPEIQDLVAEVLRAYHTEFWDLDVKIMATMVSKLGAEDELVPCLKLHGNSAFAIIHLVRGSQRVYVEHDAEILIDACRWQGATAEQRKALIDHELEHLVLVKDRHNAVKTDDRGRPKIRLKPDDYSLTGFYVIVDRHGRNSIEFSAIDRVTAQVAQALESHDLRATPPTTVTLPVATPPNAPPTLQPAVAA